MKLVIGIDEAGRGPLAGPVTVGVFQAPIGFKNRLIKILGGKIKDSKQLSPEKREQIFKELKRLKVSGEVDFQVAHSSPKTIDKIGISKAIDQAIKKVIVNIKSRAFDTVVRLDGLLKAPSQYKNQKTIIGGDAKDVFIACASIVAKVSRDHLMCRFAKKFPLYGFEVHKGYGTSLHRQQIKALGLSSIHRLTFCKKL